MQEESECYRRSEGGLATGGEKADFTEAAPRLLSHAGQTASERMDTGYACLGWEGVGEGQPRAEGAQKVGRECQHQRLALVAQPPASPHSLLPLSDFTAHHHSPGL